MFTGIIETTARVASVEKAGSNLELWLESSLAEELKIDQSVAHNGVCLTVVEIRPNQYRVTAIEETLLRTNLGQLRNGNLVNIERCMKLGDRLDGHIVQGHVDLKGTCVKKESLDGSWRFHFAYPIHSGHVTVEKGSICINGVSLTVVDSGPGSFSVAIIPYTYEHTQFKELEVGMEVNLEFDILGKYIARLMESRS